MAEVGFQELIKRVDAVIGLLVVTLPQPDEARSLREQIRLLDSAGLGQTDISRIVDRPPKDVGSELARIRAAKKGSKKQREKE
jgi:hypothetical protein